MAIDSALVALINSLPAVTAIIGALPNSLRLYPQRYPQNPVFPLITYHHIDSIDAYSHGGFSSLVDARYQLTIWSTSYNQSETLIDALKSGLRAYRGTIGGKKINRIFVEEHTSGFEPTTQNHQRNLDLLIDYDD